MSLVKERSWLRNVSLRTALLGLLLVWVVFACGGEPVTPSEPPTSRAARVESSQQAQIVSTASPTPTLEPIPAQSLESTTTAVTVAKAVLTSTPRWHL